jgi:hypothetical protein
VPRVLLVEIVVNVTVTRRRQPVGVIAFGPNGAPDADAPVRTLARAEVYNRDRCGRESVNDFMDGLTRAP